ncbi:MAG: tetratricopeptide repeat protein [Prevotellaceae bacterium]|nr:tetratricopeptide repeat protein [Prevotellaceae bacterium]MDY3365846.1 tetratricopeptide repeat protein [Prevotella sp.]
MANNINKEGLDANESLQKTEVFFDKYKKPLLIGVVALVVIIAGFFIYKSQVAGPRAEKASTSLAKGQEYFNQEMFEQALNGDNAGYVGFAKIASDYSGTDAGNLANLYAGLCYANLNKWQEAQKHLDAYSTAGDMMVSPAAVAALGNAYAHLNQIDKAIDKLKKAASMADDKAEDGVNNSLSPTFLLQAGILLESQNKKDEALKIYQDIKKTYLNSALVQSGEVDKYIERATIK